MIAPSTCSRARAPTSNMMRANATSLAAAVKIYGLKKWRKWRLFKSVLDLGASGDLDYAGWAVRSHFIILGGLFLNVLKQLPINFSYMLHRFPAEIKKRLDFWSAWEWIFIFRWAWSLRLEKQPALNNMCLFISTHFNHNQALYNKMVDNKELLSAKLV